MALTEDELAGKIFNKWQVLRFSHKVGYNKYFICKCLDCGKEYPVYIQNVIRGLSKSCGCKSKVKIARSINKKYNDFEVVNNIVHVHIDNDANKIMLCDKDRAKWRAAIQFNGKSYKSPKRYDTPEEAYEWYKLKSDELFKDFSVFKSR